MVKADAVATQSEALAEDAKKMVEEGALVTKDDFTQFFNTVKPFLTNGKDINKKLAECIKEAGEGGA